MQRLGTALVLVPLVLCLIYEADRLILTVTVLSFFIISGWEWLQLIPIVDLRIKIAFMGFLMLAMALSFFCLNDGIILGLFLWVLIFLAVSTYPVSQRIWGSALVVAAVAMVILPVAMGSLLAISLKAPWGKDHLVYFLTLVWATDIGAYAAGKIWGQTKLIPAVSPGKTIEGAFGGFLLALFVAILASFHFHPSSMMRWLVLAILTICMAMLGDLLISMLKRRSKIKDTGAILPGHGGFLDRLDSLIAAAPIFYGALEFLQI